MAAQTRFTFFSKVASIRRLTLTFLIAICLLPPIWWRSPVPPAWSDGAMGVAQLAGESHLPAREGQMRLMGVWQLASDAREFGGYSSLLAMPDGQFQAYSDFGWLLRFSAPGALREPARLDRVPTDPKLLKKWQSDIESATRDPNTGDIWLGYEGMNMIRRHSAADGTWSSVRPPEMAHWPQNSGAESLLRLTDGRFIVMSEGGTGAQPAPSVGLFYANDPVEGGKPLIFGLKPPTGYRPTDMAQLPDGRVLILLRDFDPPFPPIFRSRLLIADPATIEKGQYWQWQTLLDFASPIPSENYEGMAIRDLGKGMVDIWIIADDNQAALEQTLLLKIRWNMLQTQK